MTLNEKHAKLMEDMPLYHAVLESVKEEAIKEMANLKEVADLQTTPAAKTLVLPFLREKYAHNLYAVKFSNSIAEELRRAPDALWVANTPTPEKFRSWVEEGIDNEEDPEGFFDNSILH